MEEGDLELFKIIWKIKNGFVPYSYMKVSHEVPRCYYLHPKNLMIMTIAYLIY